MINIDKFTEVINSMPDGLIAILVHRTPDPDAMASAAAMRLLLAEKFERESRIYYCGEISHPQNQAMKNVLKIQMYQGADLAEKTPAGTIIVDSTTNNTGFDLNIDIRIDHHTSERNGATYCDVRPVGACSSIVWDYLRAFGIKIPEEIATALILGINTDTLYFTTTKCTDLDYEAYRDLLPLIDRAALAKVNRFTIPQVQYEKEALALENLELQGSIATSFIGEINEHNRDIIAFIADKYSRMETVSTVIIMGVVNNDLVAAIRSEDTRHDVGALCTKAFGKDFSGAHEGSGGARVPLGIGFDLLDTEFKQKAIEEAIKGFRKQILEALGT